MKMILRIARMELQKMFYSPIAWLVLVVFATQSGLAFMRTTNTIIRSIGLGYDSLNLTHQLYIPFFSSLQYNLFLYIPLLTMGLISREFNSGSIKLLYSSPVSNKQIVFGKFFSMMIFGLAMVLIVLTETFLGLFVIENVDFFLILTGILSVYLVTCAYSAIGLFMSSLTSYQVVAAIGTFATLFALRQVGRMWQGIEFVRDITYWLSINGRADNFIFGMICSEDVFYFILVSALFITFTIFKLKGIRQKSPKYVSFTRHLLAFIVVALLGYISTMPSLMKYYDSTQKKTNTLTKNSQDIISKLKGKIKITTYVNIFDQSNFYPGSPSNQKNDIARYKQYSRFYPNMKFVYKYYYDLPVEEGPLISHNRRYEGLTQEQALEKACIAYDVNIKKFIPGREYNSEIDLTSELNRFVSKITTEEGRTAYLRTYNDMRSFPNESQITVAFKRLISDLPLVGFVAGHEDREVNDFGERGYFSLTKEKPFRWSLINNGFDFKECNLSEPIDKEIDILIIAESRIVFLEEELKNLNDYINRGGNLLIACDRKRQDIMNPLVERLGVRFLPGQIAEYNKGYTMDLVTAEFTKGGQKLAYQFEEIVRKEGVITLPGAVAISYIACNGFKYTPVLVSDTVKYISQIDSVGSWNELNTTDFIDNVAKYDPNDGETLGSLTTALALTRKVGDKDQRIMILGDADCLSNGEFTRSRQGINAQNFYMAIGAFYWLSNEQVPIDVRRPDPIDNTLHLKKDDMPFLNILYQIIIPILLALAGILIWLRRKGR